VNIQYLKVLTKKNYKLYQLVPMHSSWVTVALQLRVSILTSLWKEPAIVQFYIQRVPSSWLPYPLMTRSEKAHVSTKVLFQGDGTFSASMDALPLTVFTKMEDTAKSKMTLQRNISSPTKITHVHSCHLHPHCTTPFYHFQFIDVIVLQEQTWKLVA